MPDDLISNAILPANGVAFRFSYRYFIGQSKAPIGYYFSPLVMVKFTDIKAFNAEYTINETNSYSKFRSRKSLNNHVAGIKILLGRQQKFMKNFVLDQYIGIGGRYRFITFNEVEVKEYDKVEKKWDDTTPKGKFSTHELLPSFHIGVSIGLAF